MMRFHYEARNLRLADRKRVLVITGYIEAESMPEAFAKASLRVLGAGRPNDQLEAIINLDGVQLRVDRTDEGE